MGRLGDDGFLVLARGHSAQQPLAGVARELRDRLTRPVALSVSREPGRMQALGTNWVAEVGIGVLESTTHARPSHVVSTARAMARTAWSYPSRLARFDEDAGCITELAVMADGQSASVAA